LAAMTLASLDIRWQAHFCIQIQYKSQHQMQQ
jgi:hypothetical protein